MPIIEGFDEDSIFSKKPSWNSNRGAFDTLGIGKVIDRAIPKTRHNNLPHSTVIKAMSLNGSGFVERRFYLFPDFIEDLAV